MKKETLEKYSKQVFPHIKSLVLNNCQGRNFIAAFLKRETTTLFFTFISQNDEQKNSIKMYIFIYLPEKKAEDLLLVDLVLKIQTTLLIIDYVVSGIGPFVLPARFLDRMNITKYFRISTFFECILKQRKSMGANEQFPNHFTIHNFR